MADHAFAHEPHDVAASLYALGVTEEELREAVKKGLDARKRCTAFHPPSAPGYYQWAEIHVALRQTYVPLKWEASDDGGFSTVVRPDGAVAITVATGSDRTGQLGDPQPTTKYPRGAMSQAAVKANQQVALDLVTGGSILPPDPDKSKSVTWWLLVCTRHDEVRMELSRPNGIDDDGRIYSWTKRIILSPLPIETAPNVIPDDDDDGDPIDVPVERR